MSGDEELVNLLEPGEEWRTAMSDVPREAFAPTSGLACPDGPCYPIDRRARPEEWLRAVYSDTAIITQRDDGRGDPTDVSTGLASSSISAPGIAFEFLELLAPRDHDRVLEVGTGTGYTAAVLSARLGADNVTSVEVDSDVAERAAANLKAAGYAPHLLVGDGAVGCPERAPYDRVHVTCAVTEIPYAWVEQTRPGGIIVAPWQPLQGGGLQVRLTVVGEEAHGRFHGPCGYMMLRAQRAEVAWKPHHHDRAEATTTRLDPRTVDGAAHGVALVAMARAPGLGTFRETRDDGSFSLLLFEVGRPEGAWAACDYEPGADDYEVTQYGDRHLWDELADAYLWWVAVGCPDHHRFGLTVTPEAGRLWLDDPYHGPRLDG